MLGVVPGTIPLGALVLNHMGAVSVPVPWQMAWGTEHVLQAGLRAEKGLGGNPGSGVGRPGVLHTFSEPQFLLWKGA